MRTALMVLALLAAPAFASQTVWKWVDEKGVTHYSDRPVPGAQRIEVTVGSRADPVPTSPAARSPSSDQSPAEVTAYRDFEIWRPGEQETVANTGGAVEVSIRLDPPLMQGHSIHLYLDGRLVQDFPPQALEYTVQDVPRGEHTLTAIIEDRAGRRLQETSVRFFVRQQSIAQPPVGPALRQTPPKPGGQASNKLPSTQPSYTALHGQRPQIDPRTNLPVSKK